ncbi:MAG: aminotransferase class III-fold pyridoxal phosphate-dependent enzyme [Desulfobacterales bacterium]|nr:aminotransferase class III-fold pyridoxal phosphate-dependent enzyme [Desulfobacterales bacterium]
METFDYPKSRDLFTRAAKVVPCGIYGHFSPAPLVPPESYPFYTARAAGSRFWDVDGNEFIDYMCAYGPMITGYNREEVDQAAMDQLKRGNCTTGAPEVMVDLAEYLVDLIPSADWAFFAKNGGDLTDYATMIARDATGRKKIVMIGGGYHGVASWMQAPGHHGLIEEDYAHIIRIPWNDADAFEQVIGRYPDQIAGFIATPYHVPAFADNELPAEGYWQRIETLCRKNGIVLIVDDIRHGFRFDMGGSCEYFGFKPDLICFCKALANGYPISALVGNQSLKDVVARVFYTGSYWFSAVPMAAALANLKLMKEIDAPRKILETGNRLLDGMVDIAKGYGYDLKVTGAPSMPYLRITNDPSLMLHQDWCAECTKRGVYFTSHHNWFISTAHTDRDIEQTLAIVDEAFKVVKAQYGDSF